MKLDLNKKQLNRLSEFIGNVGIVLFATIVTPILTGTMVNYLLIITGLFMSMFSLFISLYLLK
ncbi:MAG: hypothetical protein UR42_C0015G0007 [Candidatus Roizmanbacteria bacterium GW2011_GWA2_33_33]|uniref:Uncharacterized protein n=2 Tax=Candidatus Roizmaniibacteriota TaxID=1752723 RepID=A0A0G0ATR2_9BACT|nr:MAG: hypothetical protein UR42_C0015G0007 [Candidatus Roizmanbacteria bacterium GW2011_GWA2_33_33]KKP60568.1 MAG: hypothetical protein UR56_C0022G0015 [Candidatus Roizmanbacteria bacterium GW2011_GWC2_34_23]